MKLTKRLAGALHIAGLFLIGLVLFSAVNAQTNAVDLTFNAVPDKDSLTPPSFVVQPDNKIIVFGVFQTVNGAIRNQIVRFNQDGSLDNSFNCAVCSFVPTNVLAQPDGKILVSGAIDNGLQAIVYRLNPDGSRDSSFNSPFAPIAPPGAVTASNSATVNEIQPNGKILVTLNSYYSGYLGYVLYRLNADGTFDSTFSPTSIGGGRLSPSYPRKVGSLPDGKILVAGFSNSVGGYNSWLFRIGQNGNVDSSFEAPAILGEGGSTSFVTRSLINDFDIQADGSYIVVGDFVTVNALSRRNAVKIAPAGNVDLSFNNTNIGIASRVEILPDGKFLIGTANRINRYNADGSPDNTFATPVNLTTLNRWTIDTAGRVVLFGVFTENGANVSRFARLNQNGIVENSFAAGFGIAASVTAVGAQADGKVVFTGDFIRVNGAPRTSIARVNADGSLDSTFNTGSGFDNAVSKIVVQPDAKIIVVGNFSVYNGSARPAIARLNADGSLDTAFNPNIPSITIEAVALQADGKIIVGGSFSSINGQTRTGVARFNADGSLDASFNPIFGSPYIRSLAVQSDGKILVGGTFNGVNGFSRTGIVRLNADGTLDSSFNAGNVSNVVQIEIVADGKYLVLGNSLFRLNSSGSSDTSFSTPVFQSAISDYVPLRLLVQPDGSIFVGGNFVSVNNVPRSNFARLRPNGSVDTGFLLSGANNSVRAMTRQADGRILVGGDFSVIGGVTRTGIARLNVAAYRLVTRYDFDGDARSDVAVFRPATGGWYVLPSQTNNFYGFPFGQAGDQIAPADYDGDGKTDIAVFREVVPGAGDKAYFYIINSADNSFRQVQFGTQNDVPLPGDWDGDGRTDFAVYRAARAAGGQSYFYYRPSAQPTVDYVTIPLGTAGDQPLSGDFDGDGRLDPAVFRSRGAGNPAMWLYISTARNQLVQISYGLSTDIPVPADYDGDGLTNLAVFRPSNGTWYTSADSANNYGAVQFGASGDLPIAADYDGDGRADIAVFRPSNGAWYLNRSTSGFTGLQFGAVGDKPAPNAFVR